MGSAALILLPGSISASVIDKERVHSWHLCFHHAADLGYGVVSREANLPWGIGCCAEFTFIKVEKPAGC